MVRSKNLEKAIGEFALAQTSVFGRYGGAMLNSLYDKLREYTYSLLLTPRLRGVFRRTASALMAHIPRPVELRRDKPDCAIYTDAEATARVLSAIALPIPEFRDSRTFDTVCSETIDQSSEVTFDETAYNSGLEMLSVLATVLALGEASKI